MIPSSSKRLVPKRGWLYLADLGDAHGAEPGKLRPVLALQTDLLNPRHNSTVVLPLTTQLKDEGVPLRVRLFKGEGGLRTDSEVVIDQIRSIDNRRLRGTLGAAPAHRVAAVERAVALLLDLPEAAF